MNESPETDDGIDQLIKVLYAAILIGEVVMVVDLYTNGRVSDVMKRGTRGLRNAVARLVRPVTIHRQWKQEKPGVVWEAMLALEEGNP